VQTHGATHMENENKQIATAIELNEFLTLHLSLPQEMDWDKFSELMESFTVLQRSLQKKFITPSQTGKLGDLTRRRSKFVKTTDEEKLAFLKKFNSLTNKERSVWAEELGVTKKRLQDQKYYFKKYLDVRGVIQ